MEMVMQGDFSGGGGGDPICHACEVGMVMRGGHMVRMPTQGRWEVRMPTRGGNGHARYEPRNESLHSLLFYMVIK